MIFQNTKQKPQLGARLNYGHPFARNLELDLSFLEASADRTTGGTTLNRPSGPYYENSYDLVKGIPAGFASSAGMNPRWYGNGVRPYYSEVSRVTVSNNYLPDSLFLNAGLTVATKLVFHTGGITQLIANKTNTANGDGSCPLYLYISTDNRLYWIRAKSTGSTNYRRWVGPTITVGKLHTIILSVGPALDDTPSFYLDGVRIAGTTFDGTATGLPLGAGEPLRLFSTGTSNYPANCTMEFFRLYSRPISAEEASWITDEPYAHLIYPSPIKYFSELPDITSGFSDDLNSWNEAQVLGHGLIHADDAANLVDASESILGHEPIVSDSLNNWTDAAAYTAFEIALGLSQAVADSTQRTTGPTSSRFYWQDGIAVFMDAADVPFFISIDDLDSYNDDEIALDFAVFFNDAGSLEAYDSMQYNWADAVALDLIRNEAFGDNLFQQDETVLLLDYLVDINDVLNLSDAITNAAITDSTAIGDDLNNWSDDLLSQMDHQRQWGIFDDLNMWADTVHVIIGSSDIGYIRRYLNDVIN